MHIWFDLVSRELMMLIALSALGSGLVAFLGKRFDLTARLALAPVFGLCAGTCVFTTLVWFFPTDETSWLLPVLCLASVGVALRHGWSAPQPRPARGGEGEELSGRNGDGQPRHRRRRNRTNVALVAMQLLIVCLAVAGPIDYTMSENSSVGPVYYGVVDALGYVAETDGEEHQSLRAAAQALAPSPPAPSAVANVAAIYWERYAAGVQEIDATPLSSNTDHLLGFGSTDTQGPFLVVFLLAGALGVLAAVRYAAKRPTWAGVLAGCLFGGTFFLQLLFDGSQAAISGLAVIAPLAILGYESLRSRRPANLVLFAVLVSGLVALYPMFVPAVGLGAGLALLITWVRRLASRPRPGAREVLGVLVRLVIAAALSAVFDLVALGRDIRYWRATLAGGFVHEPFYLYDLGVKTLPGWLFQTRGLYDLVKANHLAGSDIIFAVVVPIALIALVVLGLRHSRAALILVPVVGASLALGINEQVQNHCSYCADRVYLPLAPILIVFMALGLAAMAVWKFPWHSALTAAVVLIVAVPIAMTTKQDRAVFASAYFLNSSSRQLLGNLPKHSETVDLEGFNEGVQAAGEQSFTYEMASEVTGGDVSLPADVADHDALAYVGPLHFPGPQFRPDYQYILTRAAGIQTDRRVVAREGGIALEERTGPLDVSLDYGTVGGLSARDDPSGDVWVDPALDEPVQFIVAGGSDDVPAYVRLRFLTPSPGESATALTPFIESSGPGYLDVCVEATGQAPVREADVRIQPVTIANVDLASMYVSNEQCTADH